MSIFSFRCGILGLLAEEKFLSEPNIGFLSSLKSKFRDQGQIFWLGKTMGNSNPNLTLGLKNPKILKHIVYVDSLYLEIGEGSGAKNFKDRI